MGRGVRLAAAMGVAGLFYMVVGAAGQRMMEAAQVMQTRQQFAALNTAVTLYAARYNALPGDDGRAAGRWGLEPADQPEAHNNGIIDGPPFDHARPETEALRAWGHLRAAGVVDGDPALIGIAALPRSPLGGYFFLAHGVLERGNALCVSGIPGPHAATLSDGALHAGRETAPPTVETPLPPLAPLAPTQAYDPTQTYTLCLGMGR